jgi:protein transport protein SEC24
MMVVTELEEPFLPLPDDLLVNLGESRAVLDALLDSLPATFASTSVVDSATGPALQVSSSTTNQCCYFRIFRLLPAGL